MSSRVSRTTPQLSDLRSRQGRCFQRRVAGTRVSMVDVVIVGAGLTGPSAATQRCAVRRAKDAVASADTLRGLARRTTAAEPGRRLPGPRAGDVRTGVPPRVAVVPAWWRRPARVGDGCPAAPDG